MNTPNTKIRMIGLVTAFAIAALCLMDHARAQNTRPVPAPQFGILGITRGQTARLNVANVSSPDSPFYPPDPCRVTMSFVDANGDVLLNSAGQPVQREVTLQPGHSTFLQINGDNLVERGQLRLIFRPVISVIPDDPNLPPDPCMPTLEVINNLTGHTSLLSNGVSITPAQIGTIGQ